MLGMRRSCIKPQATRLAHTTYPHDVLCTQCLPELLRNHQFTACLKSDDTTRRWLAQLLINVGFPESAAQLAHDIVAPTPLSGA